VGAANVLRDTACPISRNENDSAAVPRKTASRPRDQAAGFFERDKVLNLRGDSKGPNHCDISDNAQKKFINRLLLNVAGRFFRTTLRHYADK
jgi:hypothetical protein